MVDNFRVRSNQRAELCAAKLGIELFAEAHAERPKSDAKVWIIATDSEYVVKGMTEWLPNWRSNNWCTSKGTPAANLDLFLALDSVVTTQEAKNITIGFWHIPRKYNTIADRLAKAAADHGDEATK
ncbi:ribonuclease H-like domain-containing protein [Massariosphaeria phaeospora]|uniref:ribonuclease H n=1 Tax=Massariosphaeria phaeospora TaxID=100035 RepID=A0A7C8M7X9_9PLEO|nr:ribonuclease H-like domain-containing protein [Massariosphaeria phaeospora]